MKLSALGDVVHTLPALNALRRHFPEAHISWLIESFARDLVDEHPALDQVLAWERRRFDQALRAGRLTEAVRVFRELLRQVRLAPYDLVIDFQGLLKSGIWVGLARGRRKVGFGNGMERTEGGHLFLSERVPPVSMNNHALDRSLLLLEAIGIPRGPVDFRLPVGEAARREAASLLADAGIGANDRFVAIHPMTRWPTKLWLNGNFAAVADSLARDGIKVVFTGSATDIAALDDIARTMTSPMRHLAGRGNLKTLAALHERAGVVVSTDTGPMHIAAAVGTPVVAIFGPTSPQRTGPYGEGHVVLRADVPCSPCFSKRCGAREVETMACMKRITPDAVVAAVRRLARLK